MAAAKYIADSSGLLTEIAGTTAATPDAIPVLDSTGRLSIAQMPIGVGAEVISATCVAGASAGHFMYFYNSTGLKTDKAIATSASTAAMGFIIANVSALATATVYGISNSNAYVPTVTMTIGSRYYLSNATAGEVATYASMTFSAGHIVQRLGVATVAGPPGTLVFDNADFFVKAA